MDNKEVIIKQIIVITDGQSNVGGNPVEVARKAFKKNIIVNTIGIMNQNQQEEKPLEEIVNIAEAGGGIYEYTYIDELHQTMQSITYKTVNKTIQEAVNKQLKEIIHQDINDMNPAARSKILHYIDTFSEEVALQTCIVMDASGSMAPKILSARHSILDLMESLELRRGNCEIAVVIYPGEGGDYCQLISGFGETVEDFERKIAIIKAKGTTPTAPAIDYAIQLIEGYNRIGLQKEPVELEGAMG
ncbi:Ca-activated chloride channel family protein [Natronincola ferrireducens]|uniref:Ca-activated chloride channel family protein n=2 Tax=Natronincola ferrireducens TaxID=393762 RepID=A0A1G9FGP1_9FIRM|nr:Ca-activated chloride channel family protein [Natronincola ferrireducens]